MVWPFSSTRPHVLPAAKQPCVQSVKLGAQRKQTRYTILYYVRRRKLFCLALSVQMRYFKYVLFMYLVE